MFYEIKINKYCNDKTICVSIIKDKTITSYNLEVGSTISDLAKISSYDLNLFTRTYASSFSLYEGLTIDLDSYFDRNNLISINSSSIDELKTLPGIGETIALRIIEYREANDGFKYVDELMNIKGIGLKKYEKLKSYIIL